MMKLSLLCLVSLLSISCALEAHTPEVEAEESTAALSQDMLTTLQNACDASDCVVSELQRVPTVFTQTAHYSAILKIGEGEHDKIRIHRVVKETAPWKPKTGLSKSVMFVHGDNGNFKSMFMVGPNNNPHSAIATYLAQNNIDVWGMDTRWSVVPISVTDTSFMQHWNLETDAGDARTALAVARGVRALTGSGIGKMKLLGYSRGGQIAYVVTQQESQISSLLRSVDGFVVVDVPFVTDDANFQATICGITAQLEAAYANGQYADGGVQLVITAAQLAQSAPNDPSPILPGLTNLQVIVFFGGATYNFQPYTPWYHMVGAQLVDGFPVALQFTNVNAFLSTAVQVSPWEAMGTMIQGNNVICGNSTLDDNLDDVTIPMLYIGGQGGFGDLGLYTTTLLGSTDVETIVIELTGDRLTDFGHDDIWRAGNAPTLVFAPLKSWIQSH